MALAAASISSSTMADASRTRAAFSGVTSPTIRTARPGPGNGCRSATRTPKARATARTSSLYRSRSGSTSFTFMFGGRPATLWWVLIRSRSCPPLSIQSGAIVPWTRWSAPNGFASRSKSSTNLFPMMTRFFSGSTIPRNAAKNSSAARRIRWLTLRSLRVRATSSVSCLRMSPVSTYTARRRSPSARLANTAAVVLSTPPEQAMIAFPGTCLGIASTCSTMKALASNVIRPTSASPRGPISSSHLDGP